ncbi:MAG TPA: hypothetical protein OIL83_05045 [Veillonellaceae bacterium]|uniref:DUF7698 family protein n=1 Tax=Dialister hominis TaxID=2582419 RepID=UPI0035224EA4|nr:hypothetical protein [Veillonellaceae bacterium]
MKSATYEKIVQDWKAKRIPKGEWNPEVLWAYKNTYEKNERLDFKDLVEEDKIPDLVKELRRVGITEFTISSSWGDLVSRLAVWQAEGARICGVTTVLYEGSGIEPTEEKHAALLMKL